MSIVGVKILFKNKIMNKILIGICAFVSGVSKAVADTWLTHFSISIFSKYSKYSFCGEFSWARKYSNYETLTGSAFLFSKTLLVAFTDIWHLANMIELMTLICVLYVSSISALTRKQTVILIICFLVIRDVSFHLFYTYFLIQ